MADAAVWFLQTQTGAQRHDCSGLVTAILGRAGVRVAGSSRTFWADAGAEGRLNDQPLAGNLAFFDNTYDANANGQVDDALSHVAVVVSVEEGGTVVMVHFGSNQIRELRMNLARPNERRLADRVLNDILRSPGYGAPDDPRLAGQLFHGFARPPQP